MASVQEGDFVVLFGNYENIYLIFSATRGQIVNNRYGSFHHDDIIGVEYGRKVEARTKQANAKGFLHVCKPTPELLTASLMHRTQIIYTADIATIITGLEVCPGKTVIEAGTGSGSLSAAFASALQPSGRLFTFEFNEDRKPQTDILFTHLGLLNTIVFTEQRDVIASGFPAALDATADCLFLDLPAPWAVVPAAHRALKEGGRLCLFSPCIEQVTKNCQALAGNFKDIRTFEVLLKPWGLRDDVRNRKRKAGEGERKFVSYQLPMRGHTAYLTFARKSLEDETLQDRKVVSVGKILKLKGV